MPPPQKRPTPVTVIAYLNVIFGSLWLLVFLCGGVAILIGVNFLYGNAAPRVANNPAERDLEMMKGMFRVMIDSMGRHIPYFWEAVIAQVVFSILMTLLILVAGIGLFRLRPWARIACIIYGILSILEKIAGLVYTVTLVNPNQAKANEELLDWMRNNLPPNANVPGAAAGGNNPLLDNMTSVFGSFCGLIYPVIVLIIMLLPSVVAAFNRRGDEPPPGARAGDDDYFGYDRPTGKEDF